MVRESFSSTPLEVPIRVRYCECDPQGVAHHSVYPVWLEVARCDLLARDGKRYRDLESMGVYFVVARMNFRFRRPAHYDDTLTIKVWTSALGGAKLDHDYQIRRDNELIASAQTTLVCVDKEGNVTPIPDGAVS